MKANKPLHAVVASASVSLALLGCSGDGGGGGKPGVGGTGGAVGSVGGGAAVGTGGSANLGAGGGTAAGIGGTPGGTPDLDIDTGSAGARDLTVCDDVDFAITGRVIDMLIVLDRSASMDSSRLWQPMGSALTRVTAATEEGVDFGLLTFPFTNDECAPGDILIGIGDGNSAAIADVVGGGSNDVGTAMGTPTAASLRVAKAYLDTVTDAHTKYVLLATDGAPNCNAAADVSTCICSPPRTSREPGQCTDSKWCLDDADAVAAAAELFAAGYQVFVLGIGESMEWETVMNAMAQAGGTTEYIRGESDQLEAQLTDIVGGVLSCDFDVDWAILAENAVADPNLVNLYCKQSAEEPNNDDLATGNALPWYDDCATGGAGWMWKDTSYSSIRLCPDTCSAIKEGGCPVISATFGCKSVHVE